MNLIAPLSLSFEANHLTNRTTWKNTTRAGPDTFFSFPQSKKDVNMFMLILSEKQLDLDPAENQGRRRGDNR